MKVYALTLMARAGEAEALGDKPWHRQVRAIVAAQSQKRAAELFGVSLYYFRGYGGTTGNDREIEIATVQPETVFITSINQHEAPYLARPIGEGVLR